VAVRPGLLFLFSSLTTDLWSVRALYPSGLRGRERERGGSD